MLPPGIGQPFGFLPLDSALQPEGLHRTRGVAWSDLRPLPKILDCSLPEASGQCLSASDAGRALTPARHLRLGEPLPHQLANIIWAPLEAKFFSSNKMPHRYNAAYYQSVRKAIRDLQVGYPNITAPFATSPTHVLLHG